MERFLSQTYRGLPTMCTFHIYVHIFLHSSPRVLPPLGHRLMDPVIGFTFNLCSHLHDQLQTNVNDKDQALSQLHESQTHQ